MSSVIDYLEQFQDPRDPKKVKHPLPTILFISVCSISSGAETWEDMVLWAAIQKEWLSQYVNMDSGIPSYSTFRRLFTLIEPSYWGQLLNQAVLSHHPEKKAEDHIPIDGKTLRGSKCNAKDVRAMQMVSALSVENNIVLGQIKTDSKSNEITAIPLLLALLDLEGATISIDAMGCNDTIIDSILKEGGNYVIGLKKNQPTLYAAIDAYSRQQGTASKNLIEDHFDESHGRLVRRRYFAYDVPDSISELGFSDMKTVIATETISGSPYKEDVTAEWRYYITNHDKTQPNLANYIRNHWSIESYHWLLDVHLNDDRDKKYEENAAENFARTKRFLLDLVKSNPPKGKKRSIRSNLKRVGWDKDYLVSLLFV